MRSFCPICRTPAAEGDISSLPCGHIFHKSCLDELLAQKCRKPKESTKFDCPTCRSLCLAKNITMLYPIPPSSSPPRGSSPASVPASLFQDEDDKDVEDSRWVLVERATDILAKLAQSGANLEGSAQMSRQVQRLGCLFGGADDINLELKTTINRFLSLTDKIIRNQLSPTLAEGDQQRQSISELSDEVEKLSASLDAKEQEIGELTEKHRKQIAALQQVNAERAKGLDSRSKSQMAEIKRLANLYQVSIVEHQKLVTEHKEMKDRAERARLESNERDEARLRILSESKTKYRQEIGKLELQVKMLQSKVEEQKRRDQAVPENIVETLLVPCRIGIASVTNSEAVPSNDVSNEMPWQKRKAGAVLRSAPNPKPVKAQRTETKIGPLQIVNGRLNKAVSLGSRRAGIN